MYQEDIYLLTVYLIFYCRALYVLDFCLRGRHFYGGQRISPCILFLFCCNRHFEKLALRHGILAVIRRYGGHQFRVAWHLFARARVF